MKLTPAQKKVMEYAENGYFFCYRNGSVVAYVPSVQHRYYVADVGHGDKSVGRKSTFDTLTRKKLLLEWDTGYWRKTPGKSPSPLTDATRPLYEAIAALRVDGWQQCRETRLQIAELTQKIWKEARNGNAQPILVAPQDKAQSS